MKTPTIVKTTKDYMLIRVPLPQREDAAFKPVRPKGRLSQAEKRLWRVIQEGEKEYREGKTVAAQSIDEAMKIYERGKSKTN